MTCNSSMNSEDSKRKTYRKKERDRKDLRYFITLLMIIGLKKEKDSEEVEGSGFPDERVEGN